MQFQCFECRKTFSETEVKKVTLPDNFRCAHLPKNAELPQCPHCKAIAFFGFTQRN